MTRDSALDRWALISPVKSMWADYIILCAHHFPSPCYDPLTLFPKGKAIFPCSFGGLVEITDFGFSQMSASTEAEASEIWCSFLNFLKKGINFGEQQLQYERTLEQTWT